MHLAHNIDKMLGKPVLGHPSNPISEPTSTLTLNKKQAHSLPQE